jgi:integrase
VTTTPESLPVGQIWRDTQVPGLQLRARASGKSWMLYYRTKAGQERRPKIGDYPVLSLTKAREIARTMLADVYAGGDPSQARKDSRAETLTVDEFCDTFMERHGSKKKSGYSDQSLINAHIKPRLGKKRLSEVKRSDVEDLHARISLTAPVAANRAVTLLSKMFNMAERWDMRPEGSRNPASGITRNREAKRRRYMTPSEAKAIAATLRKRMEKYPLVVLTIQLLMFTGARRSELCGKPLRLVNDAAYISDSKEGGEKMIQLPSPALALIKEHQLEGKVLPGRDYVSHEWADICQAAGVKDLHLHDLRHTFASVALSDGLSLGQIGELLGHASTQTTQRYAHLQKAAARVAVEKTAARLVELLEGPAV